MLGIDQRQLRDLDLAILVATLLLTVIGILMIISATYDPDAGAMSEPAMKQVVWAVIGLAAMALAVIISHDTFEALSPILYGLALLLLMAVLAIGVGKTGEHRWFVVGPMRLQPSELAKFATILVLGRYLTARNTKLDRPIHLALPLLLVFVPTALILREPDLGTSAIFPLFLIPMLFWAGVRPFFLLLLLMPVVSLFISLPAAETVTSISAKWIWLGWIVFILVIGRILYVAKLFVFDKIIVFLTCIVTGIAGPFLWDGLKGYQRDRIVAFLNPEEFRFSTGYQLIQSKIAIGSGSVIGKGFLNGTQKNYAFLPEQHTDFIFSVVAEEFGFLGCLVLLSLIMFLVVRMFRLAGQVRNRFASVVIVGIASTLFIQSAVNVGVTLGLAPVTGMPLPFVSYGGSSLLVTLTSVGIVLGMGMRRMEY
jgi:rod shape determining protein RodA